MGPGRLEGILRCRQTPIALITPIAPGLEADPTVPTPPRRPGGPPGRGAWSRGPASAGALGGPVATPPRPRPLQAIRLARPARAAIPRPALDYIRSSSLFEVAQRMIALEQDLQQIQPTLRLKPIKLDKQVLLVTAPSAAVGARLRQFEPSLLAGLRARGWLVNRLRFRAQMAATDLTARAAARNAAAKRVKPAIGQTSLAALEKLHRETLTREGEPSPLARALASFIERQRRYRETDG